MKETIYSGRSRWTLKTPDHDQILGVILVEIKGKTRRFTKDHEHSRLDQRLPQEYDLKNYLEGKKEKRERLKQIWGKSNGNF